MIDSPWFPALLTVVVFWVIVLLVAIFDPGGQG